MRRQLIAHRICWYTGLYCAFILLAGCTRLPTVPDRQVISLPSPSHDERRPNFVIIHQTSNDDADAALRTLTDPARKVSAHYLIGRDGTLFQLVDDSHRAWHAGVSYWGGNTDLNSSSIGIELDNNGEEPFAEPQIVRLIELLKELQERYRIPAANILGHGDIAPRRKVDPSRLFPWARLADEGYGLWCRYPGSVGQEDIDPRLALQAIGYDLADPSAALTAFRRHFLGSHFDGEADDAERRLLHCLVLEKRNKPEIRQ